MEPLRRIDDERAIVGGRDVDRYVARRLRNRRIIFGLKQREMADRLGLSPQQVHKYETGSSRISIGRLFEMADILGVGIEFFFEGLNAPRDFSTCRRAQQLAELARNFNAVQDVEHKIAICKMARLLADDDDE